MSCLEENTVCSWMARNLQDFFLLNRPGERKPQKVKFHAGKRTGHEQNPARAVTRNGSDAEFSTQVWFVEGGNFFPVSSLHRPRELNEKYQLRTVCMENHRLVAEDKVARALRVVSRSRILSTMEFLDLHSILHLRVDFRVLSNMKRSLLDELMVTTKHAKPRQNPELISDLKTNEMAHWIQEKLSLN